MASRALVPRAWAVLRGGMLIAFMFALVFAAEKTMPGSSVDPARRLALMFASRTVVLGGLMVLLALLDRREALSWVLFVDVAFQIFDVGLAFASGKAVTATLPALLGGMDAFAGITLLRSMVPAGGVAAKGG